MGNKTRLQADGERYNTGGIQNNRSECTNCSYVIHFHTITGYDTLSLQIS